MVAVHRPIARRLPMVEGRPLIGLPHRTVAGHPRIVPRRRLAVAAVIEEAVHLPRTVVEAGRRRLTAEVVAEEGDVPLLAADTAAIANQSLQTTSAARIRAAFAFVQNALC